MPPEVARIYDTAQGTVVEQSNIKCFILTPEGEVEAVFNAFPGNNVGAFGFDRDKAGRFFAESVRHFSSELEIPEPAAAAKETLALPETLRDGTPADGRLVLHISPQSRPFQYLSSVAEALLLGEELRRALSGTDKEAEKVRTIPATTLSTILKHFYPPAIMQNTGAISAVEGSLSLMPLGTDSEGSRATLTGEVVLTLDDGSDTTFPVTVDAMVTTDPAGGEFKAVRGILEGVCPKVPGRDGRGPGHQLEMRGTFESFREKD